MGSQNNDYIVGNDFDNTLSGFAGSDTLIGGGGNDTLIGGSSNSTLTGGDGADSFTLSVLGNPKTDFSFAEGDKINFVPGFSPASLDQFAYNPGAGTLSFQGTPFAILSNYLKISISRLT